VTLRLFCGVRSRTLNFDFEPCDSLKKRIIVIAKITHHNDPKINFRRADFKGIPE